MKSAETDSATTQSRERCPPSKCCRGGARQIDLAPVASSVASFWRWQAGWQAKNDGFWRSVRAP